MFYRGATCADTIFLAITAIFSSQKGVHNVVNIGSEKKTRKVKTRKQHVHGIIPGFWGGFVYVFFLSPTRNDPTKKMH